MSIDLVDAFNLLLERLDELNKQLERIADALEEQRAKSNE